MFGLAASIVSALVLVVFLGKKTYFSGPVATSPDDEENSKPLSS